MTERKIAVELKGIKKAFGNILAVKGVDISMEDGDFMTLLGPSGCGKTTILRLIAGLETATEGDIIVKGRRVNDVPIHKRNMGLVFQNYALFPHKTIFENVAFGLKYRDVEKSTISDRVKRALNVVRLPGVEERFPSQLSGGQQQRIALARAIVIEPDVLLLDEPLSALDANLREEMRDELKLIQRKLGITTVFVTHDQEEALAMSDKIIVMDHGVVEQIGAPEDVYRQPATRFVANFLGHSNFLSGKIDGKSGDTINVQLNNGTSLKTISHSGVTSGMAVEVVIRAHRVTVSDPQSQGDTTQPGMNTFQGVVSEMSYLGGTASYFIDAGGLRFHAINAISDHPFREGSNVILSAAHADCVLLDETGNRIG